MNNSKIKQLIAPIQAWLLSRGQCVGCGMPLSKAARKQRSDGKLQITCKCKRVYILDPEKNQYRRAVISEIE